LIVARGGGSSGHDLFSLLRQHPVPIWLCDAATLEILAANDAATAAYGYADAELRAMTLADLCPEDERGEVRAQLAARPRRGTRSGPWHHRRKDGGTVVVELTAHPVVIDRRRQLLVLAWDVTASRRLEEDLHRREAELHATLYSIGDAVISTDESGRVVVMNPVAERLTGWPESEARGRPLDQVFRIVNEETHQAVEDPVTRILREGIVIGLGNHTLLLGRDGREHPIADAGAPIRARDGRLTGVVLVFRDQTEERRERRAAEEARALAEGIVATAREALLVLDAALRVVVANRSFCRLFQVSPEQTVGRLVYELGHRQWDIPALRRLLEEILPRNTSFEDFEVVHEFPQIGRRTMLLNARRLHHETAGPRLILLAIEDVTARRRAEADLRRRVRELEALQRVVAALRTAQTVEEALPMLLDETLAVFETDSGSIMLYRPEDQRLHPALLRGWFRSLHESPLAPGEGIAGTVFATGRPHRSADFARDPLLRPGLGERIPPGRGGACVPIRAEAETVGVLFVSVPAAREATAEDLALLTSMAEMAGAALHRMRLYEAALRRLSHLQALRAVDRAIVGSLDLRVTLGILLEQVITQLGFDAAGVLLVAPPLGLLEPAASRGFRTPAYQEGRLRIGEGVAGRAALERRPVIITDPAEAPAYTRAALLEVEGFQTHFAVPLIAKAQVKGVLEGFHRRAVAPAEEWLDLLDTLAGQGALAIDNAQLFEGAQRSNLELTLAYDATIEGWARALDLRDRETEDHTRRVTETTLRLARMLGVPAEEMVHVRRGAVLHDIGKMGVPDAILLKPGPLSEEEWAVMRRHPQLAYELLWPIPFLRPALDIPYAHHERWDGSGYPRGLKGEAIPLAARIFAVVDVFDALTSPRPYRPAWSREQALAYIREQAGRQFDPRVVEAFLSAQAEIT